MCVLSFELVLFTLYFRTCCDSYQVCDTQNNSTYKVHTHTGREMGAGREGGRDRETEREL